MINLDISDFSNQFNHLNGQTTQDITPLDVARGMITVGRRSWTDVYRLGIFRIGELLCKALAFSKIKNGELVMQDRFFNLNQSEKATVSYYFGQALTKLFAEEFFNIKWLLHVDDINIQYHINGTAASKTIVGKTSKIAQRPDLIGIKGYNASHIFEAKGNSGGYNTSIMQHAINQVSQVRTYNNVAPLTRTACYYDLSDSPIWGRIIDPENDKKGIDISFNENEAISKYYSFFIENQRYFNNLFHYSNYDFLTTPVGVPNIYFGFDKRILSMKSEEIIENGLYSDKLKFQTKINSEFQEVSIGLDGLILLNRRKTSG